MLERRDLLAHLLHLEWISTIEPVPPCLYVFTTRLIDCRINLVALSLPDMEPVSLVRVDPHDTSPKPCGPLEEDLPVAMETWKVLDGSLEGFNLEMRKGSERLALLRRSHK
jgi:hypothetical protein